MLERLPLMNGVLTARAMAESEQNEGTVSGVPVGRSSGVGVATGGGKVEHVESTGAMLTGHPQLAGLVDYVQVSG